MQEHLFFVTAAYGFAGCVLAILSGITIYSYLRTRKRYNALNLKKK